MKDKPPLSFKEIKKGLSELRLLDALYVRRELRKLNGIEKNTPNYQKQFLKLNDSFITAKAKYEEFNKFPLKISYDDSLPISQKVDEIKKLLNENQVIIVCGATGSGKTTQLPKIAYDLGYGRKGRIACTQPRRLAATSVAKRVADETDAVLGREVGYKVRFDDSTTSNTKVKFMTDGILLAETISDKLLLQYDCIVIDEAHERSLNIDFLLGYLKNILKKRPDLKVIISSATLDYELFADFYDNAPVVEVEGRTFPVEDYFLPPEVDEELSKHTLRAIKWISEIDDKGDILVFLPGEREIVEAKDLLERQRFKNTDILALYGRLSSSEQNKVFKSSRNRKIILSTNVAETSLTIPGIIYVIDSGLVRISRYNPLTQVQSLVLEQVSKASARQRRGRCGRVTEGLCIHLYSEQVLDDSLDFTDPEIKRTSLAGVILQMIVIGLPDIEEFPFIEPPKNSLINEGFRTLFDLGAIDNLKKITGIGRKIAEFSIDPHFAKMLLKADEYNLLEELILIVSYLTIQDPKERPLEKTQQADFAHKKWIDEYSDFMAIINLWNDINDEIGGKFSNSALRKFCKKNFLNFIRVKEWFNLVNEIRANAKKLKLKSRYSQTFLDPDYDLLHKAIFSGLPRNILMVDEEKLYTGAKRKKITIFPGSGVAKSKKSPKWMIYLQLVHTSKLFARTVAKVDSEWLLELAPHLCKKVYKDVLWQSDRGFVSAKEIVMFGGLIIRGDKRVYYGKINPEKARECFIKEGLVLGDIESKHLWFKRYRTLIANIKNLEIKLRRPDFLIDLNFLEEHFDSLIPANISSVRDLELWLDRKKVDIVPKQKDVIVELIEPIDFKQYPDTTSFYGRKYKLKYFYEPHEDGDGINLIVSEKELNLLPDWACDWLVPGYLEEKLNFLLRSLPKKIRVKINPIGKLVADFMELANDSEFREQFLFVALTNLINENYDLDLKIEDFDEEVLPSYLIMKIRVQDEKGNLINLFNGVPNVEKITTQVQIAIDSVKKWLTSGKKDWPLDEKMPFEVKLDDSGDLKGYLALYDDDDSVGVRVFTDSREANQSHNFALARLFRILYPDNIKFLKRNFPLSQQAKLSLSQIVASDDYIDDMIDAAIIQAITDYEKIKILDKESFHNRCEVAKEELYDFAQIYAKKVSDIMKAYDSVILLTNEVAAYEESFEDIDKQLELLFIDSFLKYSLTWRRYPAYLKGLELRCKRIDNQPDQDLEKLKNIEPFQELFDLKYNENELNYFFDLKEYFELLQEFRLSQFAPECRGAVKVTAKKLKKFWEIK